MGIVTFVSLLPIICGKHQEIELIRGLTSHFNFDHHFYLMHSSVDTNRYVLTEGITPQSLFVFKDTDNDTELEDVNEINSKNSFLIVVHGSSQFDHQNFDLFGRMEKIQRLQINMKIGVFFSQPSSMEDLHAFFEWCKENLIVDIFAATYTSSEVIQTSCPESSIHTFTFDPFGTFEVVNVTENVTVTYNGFFLSQNSNFQQHQLKVPEMSAFDTDEKLWLTVIRHMNASFVEVSPITIDVANEVDIWPYLNSLYKPEYFKVYPVEIRPLIMIVPEALPYSELSALLRNATSGKLICYSSISVVSLILVLSIIRCTKQKNILFFRSVADVFNLLMNDNGKVKYQLLSCSEIFVIVPLTFVGLIVTNGILSSLQSHLTRPILQHQIDTLEEIFPSPFPIYVYSNYWREKFIDILSNRTGKDWSNKIHKSDVDLWSYMVMYSQNMSFIDDLMSVQTLLNIQKRFEINGYHKTDITVDSGYAGYLLGENFLYFERLNDIIHRIKSAGLLDLWYRQDSDLVENELARRFRSENENVANVLVEFPTFLFYGWGTGFIVLILEILWKHFEFTRVNENLRMFAANFNINSMFSVR